MLTWATGVPLKMAVFSSYVRCVQELGTFLAPQNRIQGRCEIFKVMAVGALQSNVLCFNHSIDRSSPGLVDAVPGGEHVGGVEQRAGAAHPGPGASPQLVVAADWGRLESGGKHNL